MKRFLSLLVVLALVLSMVPAVFAAEAETLTSVTDESVTSAGYTFTYTAETAGTLTVTAGTCSPGWRYKVYAPGYESSYLGQYSAMWDSNAHNHAVEAGEITVVFYAYANYENCAGTVSFDVTFTPADSEEVVKEVYEIVTDTALALGDNTVTALATAENTLYEFTPAEIGVYTFTAPEGVLLGNWNTSTFPSDLSGDAKTNVVEWECNDVGQSILIGITEDTTITVAKSGESEGIVQTEWIMYENVHTPNAANAMSAELASKAVFVDVTSYYGAYYNENDGYYHLDSTDGPVLYMSFTGVDGEINFTPDGLGLAITMRGTYVDDEGNEYNYDFVDAIRSGYAPATGDVNCYPLTEDLVIFLKAYGEAQKWYDPEYSPYAVIANDQHSRYNTWLVNCCYVPIVATVTDADGVVTDYASMEEAMAAAEDGDTVTLMENASGTGFVIDKDITIDFNYCTYTLTAPVGSTGTVSNGLQILEGNTVTLKNGTLEVAEANKGDFYILVQNYANLTVNNMTLDGTNLDKYSGTDGDSYTLSNNSGNVSITGYTNIIANDEGDLAFAFDVCKYMSYEAPVVTVDTTGTITGNIEVSEGYDANLQISAGTYTMDVSKWCVEGMVANDNGDGTYTVNYPVGSALNPILIEDDHSDDEPTMWGGYVENATVTDVAENVPANTLTYYYGYMFGMTLTVDDAADLTISYDGTDYVADANGVITIEIPASYDYTNPPTFGLTSANGGSYDLVFTYPEGTTYNPAELNIGENVAAAPQYSNYCYEWVATEDGVLTITIDADCTDWGYVINNLTTYQYGNQQSSATEDWWGNPLTPVWSDSMEVSKGDVVAVDVWTNSGAAGEVKFVAEFVANPGTASNPILILENVDDGDESIITMDTEAQEGETYYAAQRVQGAIITVTGEGDFTVTYGETVVAAVEGVAVIEGVSAASMWNPAVISVSGTGEYTIVISYPEGTYTNPAELVLGDYNTATVAEGEDEGYYYTWTNKDLGLGVLYLIPKTEAAGWFVQADNQNTYVSISANSSEGDGVSLLVDSGESVKIVVNTYDPENPYAPSVGGAVDVYAVFVPIVAELNGVYYISVADALADAVDGDVVNVIADSVEGGLIIKPGVTLNLANHTVEAEYVIGLNGSMVTGTTPSSKNNYVGAKLVVAQGSMVLAADGPEGAKEGYTMIPVWDEDHYFFAQVAITSSDYQEFDDASVQLDFWANGSGYMKDMFKAEGSEDHDVSFILSVSWMEGDVKVTQEYYYTTNLVKLCIAGKSFNAKMAECDEKENLVFNFAIVTASGVKIVSDPYEYNA